MKPWSAVAAATAFRHRFIKQASKGKGGSGCYRTPRRHMEFLPLEGRPKGVVRNILTMEEFTRRESEVAAESALTYSAAVVTALPIPWGDLC